MREDNSVLSEFNSHLNQRSRCEPSQPEPTSKFVAGRMLPELSVKPGRIIVGASNPGGYIGSFMLKYSESSIKWLKAFSYSL